MLSYTMVVLTMPKSLSMREPGGDTAQPSKLLRQTNVTYF